MAEPGKRPGLALWLRAVFVFLFMLLGSSAAAEEQMKGTFENIEISGVNTANDYVIQPETVSVTLRWPAAYFSEALPKEEIVVYIDMEGLGPGLHVMPAKIRLPEKAGLIRVKPTLFTVIITPSGQTGTKEE